MLRQDVMPILQEKKKLKSAFVKITAEKFCDQRILYVRYENTQRI